MSVGLQMFSIFVYEFSARLTICCVELSVPGCTFIFSPLSSAIDLRETPVSTGSDAERIHCCSLVNSTCKNHLCDIAKTCSQISVSLSSNAWGSLGLAPDLCQTCRNVPPKAPVKTWARPSLGAFEKHWL